MSSCIFESSLRERGIEAVRKRIADSDGLAYLIEGEISADLECVRARDEGYEKREYCVVHCKGVEFRSGSRRERRRICSLLGTDVEDVGKSRSDALYLMIDGGRR